ARRAATTAATARRTRATPRRAASTRRRARAASAARAIRRAAASRRSAEPRGGVRRTACVGRVALALVVLLAGCASAPAHVETPPPEPRRGFVLRGGTVLPRGDVADVEVLDGRIARVGAGLVSAQPDVDATGRFVVPAVIDAHVHLAYLPHALA